MSLKQGTPKQINYVDSWSNDYGTFHHYDITFDNGDTGFYNSKSENQEHFKVGVERWYEIEEVKNGIKIKPAKAPEDQKPAKAGRPKHDQSDTETSISIEKQVIFKGAVKLIIAGVIEKKDILGFMNHSYRFFREEKVEVKPEATVQPEPEQVKQSAPIADEPLPVENKLPF